MLDGKLAVKRQLALWQPDLISSIAHSLHRWWLSLMTIGQDHSNLTGRVACDH